HRQVRAGDGRRPPDADRRRGRTRLRVDEVAARLGRTPRAAHRHARGRDAGADPARARLRVDLGRDGRRRRRARRDDRVRDRVAGRARQAPARARRGADGDHVKILVVSGIWPPDVGGPASHAPEVAEFLRGRGHEVEVVITAPRAPAPEDYPVHWISRAQPVLLRYLRGALLVRRLAGGKDVVYSTGMYGRTRVGSLLARVPSVVKLTGDPAYERAFRYGLTGLAIEDFQRSRDLRIAWLKAVRDLTLWGARRYVIPSASLGDLAREWHLVPGDRIIVLPNPISVPEVGERGELRRRHRFEGPTLVFAGRLSLQKSLDVALRAVAACEGVSLVLAGDGPERSR